MEINKEKKKTEKKGEKKKEKKTVKMGNKNGRWPLWASVSSTFMKKVSYEKPALTSDTCTGASFPHELRSCCYL